MTAVGLAQLGHRVFCVDVPEKIEALGAEIEERGEPKLFEPGFAAEFAEVSSLLTLTDDYGEALGAADLVVVAVGTPPAERADPDPIQSFHGSYLAYVAEALDTAVDAGLSDRHILVMKSTVPAGTSRLMTSRVEARLRRRDGGDPAPVRWVSCPEFLREGTALEDFRRPDRIVIGSEDPAAGDRVAALFAPLDARVVRMDTTSAEMVKLGANGLLAAKITFANELANLCDLAGADVEVVTAAIGREPDIGKDFLRPGVGFGGSCFPKDVRALRELARDFDESPALLDAVLQVNARQTRRAVEKLEEHLGSLDGKEIAVLGLAFKPNTNDVREALSVPIMQQLAELGARVRAYDPHVATVKDLKDAGLASNPHVSVVTSVDACVEGADGLVLVTEWKEFGALDWPALREKTRENVVVDGRCALEPDAVRAAGFVYDGVGRRVRGGHSEAALSSDEIGELIAEAADAYRAVKATFGGEVSSLCQKCGADPMAVARGIGLDHRLGEDHLIDARPGRYTHAVQALIRRARDLGYTFELVEAVEPAAA
ncbi:MAG: nucleotide sugar dehydrogenase [Actinomycetota bacterium]|nr:nucleotide sugar dehydrogenase [Actinomycetota bacterium]